jgi:RNA polymerase sigma-70 factor (ECF subfamily)
MMDIKNDVIRNAALGDMGAFEEIYRAFSSMVYTVALGITGDRQDAEEVTQDVFVRIHRRLGDFAFASSFGTWVYRITVNAAINANRSRARRMRETPDGGIAADAAAAPQPAAGNGPRDEDLRRRAQEMLENLSADHRSVIVLREIEGLGYRQIAGILGVPLNTVRSRLKRAREALIALYRKEGGNHEL